MKKKNIILILAIAGIFMISGFIAMSFHYKNSTIDQIYSEKVSQYQDELEQYNSDVAENNEKTDQYNTKMDAHNEAVEADSKKYDIPEDGLINVSVVISVDTTDDNSVGTDWKACYKINGQESPKYDIPYTSDSNPDSLYESPSETFSISENEPLTISVTMTEKDKKPDIGTADKTVHYTNQEIIDSIDEGFTVEVQEDAGRYTDNVANIIVSMNIKREIDKITIPPAPDKPKLVSVQKPIKPEKADIEASVFDIIKHNEVVEIYTILSAVSILIIIIAIGFMVKKENTI